MLQAWFLLRPLSVVCRCLSSPCIFTWSFYLHAYGLISSSYKDSSHVGLWPMWVCLHFNLISSLRTLCCCLISWVPFCNPMDCRTPFFPVLHHLLVFAQTHVHWVSDAICHPTVSSSVVPFSSCLQSFQASESLPMSELFAWGGQRIRASTSASVLQMNIQGWFPLRRTGLISLQSKGLSRVFSNTTVRRHQLFSA